MVVVVSGLRKDCSLPGNVRVRILTFTLAPLESLVYMAMGEIV